MRCFLLLCADVVVKDVIHTPAAHHLQLSKYFYVLLLPCVYVCLDVGMRDVIEL